MYRAVGEACMEVTGTHHSGYQPFHKYISGFVHFQVALKRSRIGSYRSIKEKRNKFNMIDLV